VKFGLVVIAVAAAAGVGTVVVVGGTGHASVAGSYVMVT
jgi:hypothetical protein